MGCNYLSISYVPAAGVRVLRAINRRVLSISISIILDAWNKIIFSSLHCLYTHPEIILGMGSANERRCYNVMSTRSALLCWVHTQNDLCTRHQNNAKIQNVTQSQTCPFPISDPAFIKLDHFDPWMKSQLRKLLLSIILPLQFDGILPKGPYPPCLCMADRALLAGYPRIKDFFFTCGKDKITHMTPN